MKRGRKKERGGATTRKNKFNWIRWTRDDFNNEIELEQTYQEDKSMEKDCLII